MTGADEKFMARALEEARKGVGKTDPNPAVGAVIVEDGCIVALGFHEKDGGPHAEIRALQNLGRRPGANASMYVTLEPCSTAGRTGACTDAIIQSGIRRVVIGTMDPNPAHRGRAVEILKAAHIEVIHDILERECRELNPGFNQRMKEK